MKKSKTGMLLNIKAKSFTGVEVIYSSNKENLLAVLLPFLMSAIYQQVSVSEQFYEMLSEEPNERLLFKFFRTNVWKRFDIDVNFNPF